MSGLSEYELQRERNIAENNAHLQQLGLEGIVPPPRAVHRAAPRRQAVRTLAPTRASARLAAIADSRPAPSSRDDRRRARAADNSSESSDDASEYNTDASDASEEWVPPPPPKRARAVREFTEEELQRLQESGIAGNLAPELSEAELAAVKEAREAIATCGGGWSTKRAVLKQTPGLRWPPWLGLIASRVRMGATHTAQDQTMLAIECAACGLGLRYHAWPEGVGVLLSDNPRDLHPPRPLTLISNAAALKDEGRALEHRYGRDVSNGWAYNHALGKLQALQMLLLD